MNKSVFKKQFRKENKMGMIKDPTWHSPVFEVRKTLVKPVSD